MPLLNYTTQISIEKTLAEITGILIRGGASAIMSEYDKGVITAISFKIQTPQGVLPIQLPCRPEACMKVLNSQVKAGKIPRKFRDNLEQAVRVAWRIIKDWIEAQLALVQMEQADIAEVFMPYAITTTGETVYRRLMDPTAGNILALEHKP